jgi:hypothetical protein
MMGEEEAPYASRASRSLASASVLHVLRQGQSLAFPLSYSTRLNRQDYEEGREEANEHGKLG